MEPWITSIIRPRNVVIIQITYVIKINFPIGNNWHADDLFHNPKVFIHLSMPHNTMDATSRLKVIKPSPSCLTIFFIFCWRAWQFTYEVGVQALPSCRLNSWSQYHLIVASHLSTWKATFLHLPEDVVVALILLWVLLQHLAPSFLLQYCANCWDLLYNFAVSATWIPCLCCSIIYFLTSIVILSFFLPVSFSAIFLTRPIVSVQTHAVMVCRRGLTWCSYCEILLVYQVTILKKC